jgi:CRP-like cAMP-binding protein
MPRVAASKKLTQFDPKTFLSTINGGGRKVAAFSKKQTIFVQGDSSDAVFYIQKGKVKLTVVSKAGKEATIGILNEGSFLGEGCLTGQTLRLCSATAMTDCSVMRIEKKSMVEVLHRESAFSEMSRLSWNRRRRSFAKIAERTYEKRAQALHRRRESNHPEASPLRPCPSFRSL